jgi:hypothetical protein
VISFMFDIDILGILVALELCLLHHTVCSLSYEHITVHYTYI